MNQPSRSRRKGGGRSMGAASVFLLLTAIPQVLSGPILGYQEMASTSSSSCALYCSTGQNSNSNSKWNYEVGKIYAYEYKVDSVTLMEGTSEQSSTVNLAATANVHVRSPCDFELKLQEVTVKQGDNNDQKDSVNTALIKSSLEANSVSFAFVDGRIIDVCEHTGGEEAAWSLNIKKGLISAFQTSVADWSIEDVVTETDVVGTCKTRYIPTTSSWGDIAVAATGGTQSFTKIKDMTTCQNNQRLYQYALNIPDINIQNIPMIESKHRCDLILNSGHLHASKCEETHVFKPLTTGTGEETHGAKTVVSQSLKFLGSTSAGGSPTPLTDILKRSNLLYTHNGQPGETILSNVEELAIEASINKMLTEFKTASHDKHPQIFTDLVHALRKIGYSQLTKIYYSVTDAATKRFFLDAVPLLKTDGGTALMAELVKAGGISESTLDIWYSTLSFYKNPSRSMVGSVLEFINDPNTQPRSSALLGVSSLVHTFCKSTSECEKLSEVQEVILKLEGFLGQSCSSSTQEDEDRIILSLKGLRNVGHVKNAAQNIVKCYEDDSNAMAVRVAAVDTLRELSCTHPGFDQGLMNMFADTTEDSELRIGSYLALMNCPSHDTVTKIKSVLTNEPVNQVGSFVWTHLTNIQETQSISSNKRALKRLVGTEFLKNKWNTDVRKFSRYFEASHYNKELNLGSTVDGNIVFSQESYVPRSAMVNLTVNLFGESLNLFEIGARAEGFENMIEDFFGPDGYFREDSFHKLLKGLRGRNAEDSERNKRDVVRTANDLISGFKSTFGKYREDEPRGNLYMRMFGRDTYYQSFNGMAQLLKKFAFLIPAKIFGYNLDDDQLNNIDFSRSSIFLDGSVVVPTVSGLPLNLAVNGTSTVQLKSTTNFNVSNIFSSGDALLEAHVYPTGTVQVSGMMSLEIANGLAKTGLKSTTKFHTNTFLDGRVEIEGFKLAKATINMPREKMEIIEVSADFFTLSSNGQYLPLQTKNPSNKITGCTPDLFSNVFGVEFCAEAEYSPNPNSPMNSLATYFAGPSKATLHMHKTDRFSKYIFKYQYNDTNAPNQHAQHGHLKEVELLFDTPGSNINRRSTIEIKADVNNWQYVSFGMEMPFNNIKTNLVYDWGAMKKLVKGGLLMSGKNVVLFRSQLKTITANEKYEAITEFSYLDQQYLKWSGDLSLTAKKSSLNAKLEGTAHNPITFSGDIIRNGDRFTATSSITSSFLTARLSGLVKQTDTSVNVKLDTTYNAFNSGEQTLAMNGEYKSSHTGSLSRHNIVFSLNPTQFPHFNSDITWETQISSGYVENMGKIRVGRKSWEIVQQYSSQATNQLREFIFKNGIKEVNTGSEVKIEFSHKMSDLENKNKFELRLNKLFYVNAHLDHIKTSNPMSHNISTGAAYGDYQINVGLQVGDDGRGSYSGQTYAMWGVDPQVNNNQKIATEFIIRKGNGPNLDYNLQTKLEIPYLEAIEVGGTLLIDPLDRTTFALNWANGHGQNYTLDLNYKAVNHVYEINALLRMNELLYKCEIALQNDATKKAQIDLVANKHYYLNVNATNMFKNIGFEFYWDMDNNKEQSLKFESTLTTTGRQYPTVLMSFELLGHDGTFKGLLKPQGIESTINYNGDKIEAKGNYIYGGGSYGLGASVTSSLALVRDVSFLTKLILNKNANDGRLNQLEVNIDAKWNNNFKHSIELTLKKNGMSQVSGKFKTESSNPRFNAISSTFKYSGTDDTIEADFVLLKESVKHVEVDFKSKNTNAIKKGGFTLDTSFHLIQNLAINYQVRLGREIHFQGDINHNQGLHQIQADVNLVGFQSDERKLNFLIDHTWGERINGSVHLKGDDFSKEMFAAANLFVGNCGFNVENNYTSMYQTDAVGLRPRDRDDVFAMGSKLFAGCMDKSPVRFEFDLKSVDKYEQASNFAKKKEVLLKQYASVGNSVLDNFEMHGTLENKYGVIKITGDMLDGKHKLDVDASSDLRVSNKKTFGMHFNYLLGDQTHSKANVNLNISCQNDMNAMFNADFETPIAQNKKYSLKFTHDTTSNWQKMETKLIIVPGDQAKQFTATNKASWNIITNTITFGNEFDLVTPFVYLKKFELDIDGNWKKNSVLDAKVKGQWNSQQMELKVQLDKEHANAGKQVYKIEGKLNQKKMTASFFITKKGYQPNSNWIGDTMYELKFLDAHGHESSIMVTPWKQNDYTLKLAAKLPTYILKHPVKVYQNVKFENNNQCSFTLKVIYGSKDFIDLRSKIERSKNAGSQTFSAEGQFKSPGWELNGWKMKGSIVLAPRKTLPWPFGRQNGMLLPFDGVKTNIEVIDLKQRTEFIKFQFNATQHMNHGTQFKVSFASIFSGIEQIALEGSVGKLCWKNLNGNLKFEKNGKNLNFGVKSSVDTQSDSKFELDVTSTIFDPKFSRFAFDVEYNNVAKSWSIEGILNNEKLKFSGQFDLQMDSKKVKASFESTLHGFKKIDMSGSITQNGPNAYTLSFIGGSNDRSNTFDIQASTSPTRGNVAVIVKLPFISITNESHQINYVIQASGGTLTAVFNGKNYKVTWLKNNQGKMKIDITTPIQSLKKVTIEHQMESVYAPPSFLQSQSLFPSKATFRFKTTVNDNDMVSIDFEFECNKQLSLKVKTGLEMMDELLVNYNSDVRKEVHVLLKFSNAYSTSMQGIISESYDDCELGLNMTSPFTSPIRLQMGYQFHMNENTTDKIHFEVMAFQESIRFNGMRKPTSVELEFFSRLTKDAKLFVTWTNPGSIKVEHDSNTIFRVVAHIQRSPNVPRSFHDQKGKLKIDAYHPTSFGANGFTSFKDSSLSVAYDLRTQNRKVALKVTYGNKFFGVDGTFKMTEDTFDGRFVAKSSEIKLNNVKLGLKYNISVKPSVTLVIERNGVRKVINVEVTFNSIIPTVSITTPFEGYEQIIFKGDYKSNNNKKIIELEVEINGKQMLLLVNHMSSNDDYTKFGVISTLTTATTGWKTEWMNNRSIRFELGWNAMDPYSAKLKVLNGDVEYSAKGSLSISNKEFNVHVVTPFDGYEFITFGGKFGTTATGQQFGISYQQNRVKRDLLFEYDTKDGISEMSMKTPLRQIRSASARVMLPSAINQQAQFDFETVGEHHDFAFGVQWELKRSANSEVKYGNIEVKALQGYQSESLETKMVLDYKIKDFGMRDGFDVVVDLTQQTKLKNGQYKQGSKDQILVVVKQTNTFSKATITTPFHGFSKIGAEFHTDYLTRSPPSTARIQFELENKVVSLKLEKHPADDKIEITVGTPSKVYRKMVISMSKNVIEKSATFDIKKYNQAGNEDQLFKLTLNAEHSPEGLNVAHPVHLLRVTKFNVKGKMEVGVWGSWASFVLTGDLTNRKSIPFTLELKSSSPKLQIFKIEATVSPASTNSGTGRLALDIKYNEHTLNYVSKLIIDENSINAQSTLKTNIQQLGFEERKTNYQITTTNGYKKFSLKYQQEDDGAKIVDIEAVANMEPGSYYVGDKYTLKMKLFWPELLSSRDSIQLAGEVHYQTNKKGSFKFKYIFGAQKVNAKFDVNSDCCHEGKNFRVNLQIVPVNVPMLPKVNANFHRNKTSQYILNGSSTKDITSNVFLNVNDFEILNTTLKRYKTSEHGYVQLSNIILDASFFTTTKQKLEFKYVRTTSTFEQYAIIEATGTNKYANGKIDLTWKQQPGNNGDVELRVEGFTIPSYNTARSMIQNNIPRLLIQGKTLSDILTDMLFDVLPRTGSSKLIPSFLLQASWTKGQLWNGTMETFTGGVLKFSSELSFGQLAPRDYYFKAKIYKAWSYILSKYFVSDATNLNMECETTVRNTDYYQGEYEIVSKKLVTSNLKHTDGTTVTLTFYDEDSSITWSEQKSDIDFKIKSNVIDNGYVQFSGERSGPVVLLFFPILARTINFGQIFRSPHSFFNRPSSMNAKYTLDLNGNAHVCESIVNVKNVTDFDYTWKFNTPNTQSIVPFVQSSGFERCATTMGGKKMSCDGDFQLKGRNILLSGAYNPAKTDRLAYRVTRVKHTERIHSGSRRYDNYNMQYTTTIPGYESISFSRKASLDGNAFISANRTSPVDTKLTWPGGEIQLKDSIILLNDNVKVLVEMSTPFDQIKTFKYDFVANEEGGTEKMKFEGMGGYVDWKSKVEKKQENHFDIKYNVKSSWIPKTQADFDISVKADLPESFLNAVFNYGGNPVLKLESKAIKTAGKVVVNIDFKTKAPLKVINGEFEGVINVPNAETANANVKITYDTNNVEVQLSKQASGRHGKVMKAKVSGTVVPTTTLTLKYSAERITKSNLEVIFAIQNKLSATWKCGISRRKLTGQGILKGSLISNREYTFNSALDLSASKFLSKITWTSPNAQNKKELKLIVDFNASTNQLTMKFVSPFVGYENVSLVGAKSGTPQGMKFTGTANVNNVPAKVELEYTLKSDSTGREMEIKWKGTRGAKYINVVFTGELKTDVEVDEVEHKLKSSISVTGSEFAETSIAVEGEYESGEELKLSVDVRTPIAGLEKLGVQASIDFESPREFDFKVKVYQAVTIFEFQAQLAGTSDKKILKFKVVAPELGLQDENALRIELVYQFADYDHANQEKFDFEVSGAVALFGKRNEAKIKFQRRLSSQTENNFPIPSKTDSFSGELLIYSDWLKQAGFGNYDFTHLADVSVRFGCQNNKKNMPVLGVVDQYYLTTIYSCYLNNNELKFEVKEKGDVQGQHPYKYFYGKLAVVEANVKIDLQYIFNIVYDIILERPSQIEPKLNVNVLFTDLKRIKASLVIGNKGQANKYGSIEAELAANLDVQDHRFLEKVFSTLDIDMFGFKKSGSVLIELREDNSRENIVRPTRFEVTFGSDENNRIKMAMSTVSRQKRGARVARSAIFGFTSPDFGNFDFELNQEFKKGVLVLSTPRGLHKVSYEISDKNLEINNDYSILFQVETPLLDQGRAQLKLNIGNPKYTQNPADGFNVNYRGQLSLNDQHFISAAFKMDTASENKGFDTSFAIETSYLPEDWNNLQLKVNAWIQGQPKKATAKFYFRHGETRHEFDGVIDASNYEMNLMLTSPLLNHVGGHTKWALEGRLSMYQMNYSADVLFKVSDEDLVQVSFQTTFNGLTNFDGSVYYHAPNLIVSQAKVTYKVLVNGDNVLLDIDLTSSGNVDFPRGHVFVEWARSTNMQSYEGSFKIIPPTDKLPSLDGNVTVPHIGYLLNNTIRVQLYSPSGQHSITSDWDIQFHDIRGESKFSVKYIGPYGSKKVFADFGMKYIGSDQYGVGNGFLQNLRLYDIEMEANVDASTYGHKLSTTVASQGGVGLFKGDVDFKANYNDDVIESLLSYNFIDSGKELTGKIKTPFVGYEQYEFEFAFENSSVRKTAKAHATWPNDKFGVQFDFGVVSMSDFVIHVQLDVPIPGLSFNTLHVENKIKNRSHTFTAAGKWGSKSIGVKSVGYSTPFNGKVNAEANFNTHVVKVNVDKYNAIGDIKCSIKGEKIPWFTGSLLNFQTDILRDRSTCNELTCEKIEFKHQANGKRYIYVTHNPATGTAEIEFQRIVSNNMQLKTAVTYDTTADENGYKVVEIVESYKNLNDPNGKYIKTNFFLRCQEEAGSEEACPKVEFSFKTLWPSKDVSELRGYLHHDLQLNNSKLRYNVEYIQNSVQMLKYESTTEAVYNMNGMDTKQRSTLVIPSHKFMHNVYYRARLDGTVFDHGHELEWGKTNDGPEKMKNVGFAFSKNKVWELGLTESKLVLKRRIQGDVNQVMTFRFTNGFGTDFGNGDKYKEIEFKAQHPSDQTLNLNVKMRFEHNCNHETSTAKLSLKRKWGNAPNFSEFTAAILLNKIDGSVVIDSVLPDGTIYNMEGAITASNVLGELRHGFSATLTRNGNLDRSFIITVYPVIHAVQLESVKFDEIDKKIGKTFKMFAGFVDEEADKFAIRVMCDDQMTTINHFIDHSVASLVNAIDGIGNSTDEISVLVNLSDDGDSLGANITWPPHLTNSMSNLLQQTKTALQRSHDNSDNFGVNIVREIRKVGNVFDITMNAVFSDILYILDGGEVIDQYEKVVTFLSKNIREAASYVNIHTGIGQYFENQLKTLGTAFGSVVKTCLQVAKSLHSTISSFMNGMASFANSQLTYVHTAIVDIRKEALRQIIEFLPDEIDIEAVSDYIKDATQCTRTTILRLSRVYRQFVTRFSSKIEFAINDFLIDAKKDFKLIAKEFSRNFKQFKALRKMVQFYYDYQSWLEEIHFSEHLERTTQEVERYIQTTMVHFEDLRVLSSKYFTEASDFIYSHYVTISSYPPVAFAGSLVRKAGVVTLKIIANPDVLGSYKLRRLASKILARVDAVASTTVRLVDVLFHGSRDFISYEMNFKPVEGHFEYIQVLPFTWYSFKDTPDIVKLADLSVDLFKDEEADDDLDVDMIEFQHELLEAVDTVSKAITTRAIMPPFAATGFIAGDTHIQTFDGKFYDFTGAKGCSYLLVSDFLHNRFSVFATYNGTTRSSISVISDEKVIKIDDKIDPNEPGVIKVTVDRRSVDLPVTFNHTYIKREGSIITVEHNEGLRVICNVIHRVCTVTVSGWYFGKTGGLLGVYDNEIANDWMTSDREVASTLDAFVTSWHIDDGTSNGVLGQRHCPVKQNQNILLETLEQDATVWEMETCSNIFGGRPDVNSVSSLMPCYSTVDPKPYRDMCLKDMRKVRNRPEQMVSGTCLAAAAYVQQCKILGVELWMPNECIKCEEASIAFQPGESTTIQRSSSPIQMPSSADVVFVVEQKHTCSNSMYTANLRDLPKLIDKSLKENPTPITDNRFAVVGYGSGNERTGATPHIFTISSSIFSSSNNVQFAMNRLEASGRHSNYSSEVFSALKYAARLPFRPGVSKTIVLVTCDNSGKNDGSFYGDAMTMLKEGGITLHHLSPAHIDVGKRSWISKKLYKSNSKKSAKNEVYGYSRNAAFSANGQADTVLRKQINNPKDYLSTLAIQSGKGNVFDLTKLDQANRVTAKRASLVMAKNIATPGGSPPECQVCDCLVNKDGQGSLQCSVCIMPEMDLVQESWQMYGKYWNN